MNGRPRLYQDQVDRVVLLYGQGYTIREVTEMVKVEYPKISRPTVHRMLKRAGVQLRRRGSGV